MTVRTSVRSGYLCGGWRRGAWDLNTSPWFPLLFETSPILKYNCLIFWVLQNPLSIEVDAEVLSIIWCMQISFLFSTKMLKSLRWSVVLDKCTHFHFWLIQLFCNHSCLRIFSGRKKGKVQEKPLKISFQEIKTGSRISTKLKKIFRTGKSIPKSPVNYNTLNLKYLCLANHWVISFQDVNCITKKRGGNFFFTNYWNNHCFNFNILGQGAGLKD